MRRRFSILKKIVPAIAAPALWVGTSIAAPGDATVSGTPPVQVASSAPASGEQNGLVSASGEASYKIAFEVPPGRSGAAPTVQLVYGSRAPLRGGIAAGWSLPLSRIHVDTTAGRTDGIQYAVDGQRLVASNEPGSTPDGVTYRAHGDASYTIYEHVSDGTEAGYWLARSPDGSVREYGTAVSSLDLRVDNGAQYGGQGRWFLSRTVDARGNEVLYQYATVTADARHGALSGVPVDLIPTEIFYGRNVNVAGSKHFAAVDFLYASGLETCPGSDVPIGAQFTFRTGIRRYEGARKLLSIQARVRDAATDAWTVRRKLDLSYDANAAACKQPHAPLRVLSSVALTAWDAAGGALTLPPTTFTYGPQDLAFDDTTSTKPIPGNFGHGYSIQTSTNTFPITDSTLVDRKGNGSMEQLAPTTMPSGGCMLGDIPVPGFPWTNVTHDDSQWLETCSGTMQIAQRQDNVAPNPATDLGPICPVGATNQSLTHPQQMNHMRFLDMTGDGVPDLVTQLSFEGSHYDPSLDFANQYLACDQLPAQPCTANGAPVACTVDDNQKVLGVRGMGANNGNWPSPVPFSPCEIFPDMRCGWYVLRVYPNDGTGNFAQTPNVIYSPIPLDTAEYSSRLDNGPLALASPYHAFLDVDGDGKLDAVYQRRLTQSAYAFFRGDGTGHFGQRIDWQGSADIDGVEMHTSEPIYQRPDNTGTSRNETVTTLRDINGDGLPDLVYTPPATNEQPVQPLLVRYNTGNGFEDKSTSLEPTDPSLPSGTPTVRWFAASVTDATFTDSVTHEPVNGFAVAIRRPLDLDGDGLVDVASMPAPPDPPNEQPLWYSGTPSVTALVNLGDELVPAAMPGTVVSSWYRSLLNATVYADGPGGHSDWTIESDVSDVDGNGLPEVTRPPPDGSPGWQPAEAQALPYRLLTRVDNGFGASTSFTYGSVRDASLVTTTMNDATHRVASALTLVKRVDVTGPTSPVATTTYSYRDPVTLADDFGRTAFRGFEQVTEVGPVAESGAQSTAIRRYDFSVDKLGRPREVLSLDSGTLASVSQSSWAELDVRGTIPSYQLVDSRAYTCTPRAEAVDAAESDCVSKDAFERHATTWAPVDASATLVCDGCPGVPDANAPVAYVPTLRVRGNALGASQPGDRGDWTAYETHYNPGAAQWLMLPNERKSLQATTTGSFSGATVSAHAKITYDAAGHALPIQEQVEQTTRVFATTQYTYDGYGNVATMMRPNQVASGSGKVKSFSYEPFGAYTAAVVDELGQRVEHDWDIALGQPIEVRGPQQGTVMPHEHTTYDAFGRVVKRTRLKNVGNGAPTDIDVYTAQYSDTATNRSVLESTRLDYANASWQQVLTTKDALGRPVQVKRITSPSTAEITTHRYDAAGNLVETDVPNPAGATPATVAYAWSYDGLGRVTRETAPTRAPRTTQYLGPYTIITEQPTDDSVPYKKTLAYDAFRRLIVVTEGGTTKAVAQYAYDNLDRVRHIVDGDAVITDIAYWLGGQRASVTRAGSKLWYEYDLDGNRKAVHHPLPPGASTTDPKWISTFSYDELDRIKASVPAVRDMSAADQTRYLANVATAYTYDETSRKFGVGRLTTVTYPFGTVSYDYSIEGWVAAETRNLHVAPDGTTLTATGTLSIPSYTPIGTPAIMTYPDDPTYATSARWTLDLQGRPSRLDLGQNNNNYQVGRANLVRNAAGYVVSRTTTGVSTPDQTFVYDSAGRVTSHRINGSLTSGGSNVAIAGETLTFGQDGNVRSVTDASTGRAIAYTYDDLQQLKTANSGNSDYAASFGYSPGGRVTSANVQSTSPGVTARNVTYDFTAASGDVADPAAVRTLKKADGTAFGSFAYDASSNLLSKTVGGSTWWFTYDGYDRLRDTKTPSGEEIYYYDYLGKRTLTYRPAANGSPAALRHRFGSTEITTNASGARDVVTDISFGAHPALRVTNHNETAPEWLHYGVLGNLLAVLDASKSVRARYGYGPYGEVLSSDGQEAGSFDHTYEDKPRDASTGLSYFGFRFYDPLTLSWTQSDPMFRAVPDLAHTEPRRTGPFTYALNNPLRYLDPDGHNPSPPLPDATRFQRCNPCTFDVAFSDIAQKGMDVDSDAETQISLDTDAAQAVMQKYEDWIESLPIPEPAKQSLIEQFALQLVASDDVSAMAQGKFDATIHSAKNVVFSKGHVQALDNDANGTSRTDSKGLSYGGKGGASVGKKDVGGGSVEVGYTASHDVTTGMTHTDASGHTKDVYQGRGRAWKVASATWWDSSAVKFQTIEIHYTIPLQVYSNSDRIMGAVQPP